MPQRAWSASNDSSLESASSFIIFKGKAGLRFSCVYVNKSIRRIYLNTGSKSI